MTFPFNLLLMKRLYLVERADIGVDGFSLKVSFDVIDPAYVIKHGIKIIGDRADLINVIGSIEDPSMEIKTHE